MKLSVVVAALPLPHCPPNALMLALKLTTGLPSGSSARLGPTSMSQLALAHEAGTTGGNSASRLLMSTTAAPRHCPVVPVQSPVQVAYLNVPSSSVLTAGSPLRSSARLIPEVPEFAGNGSAIAGFQLPVRQP